MDPWGHVRPSDSEDGAAPRSVLSAGICQGALLSCTAHSWWSVSALLLHRPSLDATDHHVSRPPTVGTWWRRPERLNVTCPPEVSGGCWLAEVSVETCFSVSASFKKCSWEKYAFNTWHQSRTGNQIIWKVSENKSSRAIWAVLESDTVPHMTPWALPSCPSASLHFNESLMPDTN